MTTEELLKEKAYFDKKSEYFASIQFQNLANDFKRASSLIEKMMAESTANEQTE